MPQSSSMSTTIKISSSSSTISMKCQFDPSLCLPQLMQVGRNGMAHLSRTEDAHARMKLIAPNRSSSISVGDVSFRSRFMATLSNGKRVRSSYFRSVKNCRIKVNCMTKYGNTVENPRYDGPPGSREGERYNLSPEPRLSSKELISNAFSLYIQYMCPV